MKHQRKGFCLTVDGERGRRLRLAHHVLGHAGVGADISWGQTTDLQGVVLPNRISGGKTGVRVSDVARQTHSAQHASADGTDKGEQRMEQRQGEGEGGTYCVMKVDQWVSHTFLWAGRRHPSSSARWELGRHGPRTWTLRLGPPTPPGCLADGRSWGALRGKNQHAN